MNNLIKQAEKNVLKTAKELQIVLEMMDNLAHFGNSVMHDWIGKNEYFEGLKKMRSAIYAEYTQAIVNCFSFVGVGGEDVIEYAEERFAEVFSLNDSDTNYAIMHFLENWGRLPSRYKSEDQKEFRKQASESFQSNKKIKENDN